MHGTQLGLGGHRQLLSWPGRIFYPLGPPKASTIDPRLWGFGRRPSHQLVVREASTRLAALAAAHQGLLLSPSAAVRPAIWGGSTSAFATQEVLGYPGINSWSSCSSQRKPGGLGLPPVHLGLTGLLDYLGWPSIRPTGSIGETTSRTGHRMRYQRNPRASPGRQPRCNIGLKGPSISHGSLSGPGCTTWTWTGHIGW